MASAADDSDIHLPIWPPGFVTLTLEEVKAKCVSAFPESRTRRKLLADLELVVQRLKAFGVSGELWIDGSFVTAKLDPADLDFILVAEADQYDSSPELRPLIDGLTEPTES